MHFKNIDKTKCPEILGALDKICILLDDPENLLIKVYDDWEYAASIEFKSPINDKGVYVKIEIEQLLTIFKRVTFYKRGMIFDSDTLVLTDTEFKTEEKWKNLFKKADAVIDNFRKKELIKEISEEHRQFEQTIGDIF